MINTTLLSQMIKYSWNQNVIIQKDPSSLLREAVVPGSIPVLWFGDIDAYDKSPEGSRVVTVGINPSRCEFQDNKGIPNPTFRFPLKLSPKAPDYQTYKAAMTQYFANKPYMRWFWPNEAALNKYGATFGGKSRPIPGVSVPNIGLHIDIIAPLATKPWSKLKPAKKKDLTSTFSGQFDCLVRALDPDILIMPVDISFLTRKGFTLDNAQAQTVVINGKARTITKATCTIGDKPRTIVHGWNGTTPFPLASKMDIYDVI